MVPSPTVPSGTRPGKLTGRPFRWTVGNRSKTTTALRRAGTALRLDLPAVAAAVDNDPDNVLADGDPPALIDEWQVVPSVLGAVKRSVDTTAGNGRFLLTGSSQADLQAQGWPATGRIVRVPVWPMNVRERLGFVDRRSIVDRCFDADLDGLRMPAERLDVRDYVNLALDAGFPDLVGRDSERARRTWMAAYIEQVVRRDAPFVGHERDPQRLRSDLTALAADTAEVVAHKTLYDAAGISRMTALAYDNLLELLFVTSSPSEYPRSARIDSVDSPGRRSATSWNQDCSAPCGESMLAASCATADSSAHSSTPLSWPSFAPRSPSPKRRLPHRAEGVPTGRADLGIANRIAVGLTASPRAHAVSMARDNAPMTDTGDHGTGPATDQSETQKHDRRSGLSWPLVVALVAAFTWLGGTLGWFLSDRPPDADSVDVGFCLDMIAHHEQAVEMALIELANGEDPVVRGFAQEVVIFQQYEMGRMDEQLSDWGMDRRDRGRTAMEWMDMPTPASAMPGMATEEQLDRLQNAQGAAADALFLDLMAEHHRGGLHMADYAAEQAGDPDVRELASIMSRNQGVEINEYRATALRLGFDIEIEPWVRAKPDGH